MSKKQRKKIKRLIVKQLTSGKNPIFDHYNGEAIYIHTDLAMIMANVDKALKKFKHKKL